ncbi:hypothetical protein BpHYR1_025831, partial [Brachionus plicatilis]
ARFHLLEFNIELEDQICKNFYFFEWNKLEFPEKFKSNVSIGLENLTRKIMSAYSNSINEFNGDLFSHKGKPHLDSHHVISEKVQVHLESLIDVKI